MYSSLIGSTSLEKVCIASERKGMHDFGAAGQLSLLPHHKRIGRICREHTIAHISIDCSTPHTYTCSAIATHMQLLNLLYSVLSLLAFNGDTRLTDSSFLRGGHRRLGEPEGKSLPDCHGHTIDLFFNANFTIESTSEAENCTDNDFVYLGLLLERIVDELQQEYPSFKQEYIKTSICRVPIVENSTTAETDKATNDATLDRRNLKKKKRKRRPKKRYSYTSGGRCRRCKSDSTDRRLAASPKNQTELVEEVARDACIHVETAVFAASAARQGFDRCDKLKSDVDKLAQGYKQADVAETYVETLGSIHESCKQFEYTARKSADIAPGWCSLATVYAESRLEAEHCFQEAEKCSNDAMEAAKKIQGKIGEMLKKKTELKILILHQNFEIQRRELDALGEREKGRTAIFAREMDEKIALIEDKLRLTQEKSTRAQLEDKKATLERMKIEKKEQFHRMTVAIQRMQQFRKEQLDFQIKETNILLEMEGASSLDEWLSKFADLLEHKLPALLLERYNAKSRDGCLETEPLVTVTIEEKNTYAETSKNQCTGKKT